MAKLEITNVAVRKQSGKVGKTLAFADITINKCLVIKGLKVIKGSNGPFVGYPSQKGPSSDDKKQEYFDTVYPIDRETREYIQEEVLKAYSEGKESASTEKKENKETPKDDQDAFFR